MPHNPRPVIGEDPWGAKFNAWIDEALSEKMPTAGPVLFGDKTSTSNLALRAAAGDAVVFVTTGGNNANDGLSWGTAKATVAAAIAALPAGGGTVVGAGTFAVTAAITVRSNIRLLALHRRGFVIQAAAGLGSSWVGVLDIRDPAGAATVSGVQLHGLVLDANGQASTPAATIAGVSDFTAIDCQFKGAAATAVANVIVQGGISSGLNPNALSDRVAFVDCEIGPSNNQGLAFFGGSGATSPTLTNVGMVRCYVHDHDRGGVQNGMTTYRSLRGLVIRDCVFANNKKVVTGTQEGHVNDAGRTGWTDVDVSGCYFGAAGSAECGGFSEHGGRNVKVHHNTFRLGTFNNIWPVALGDNRALPVADRSRFVWVEDNYFEGCSSFDFDSGYDTFVRRNVFYRGYDRALAIFGDHKRTFVEDNEFVECGQNPPGAEAYRSAAISMATGVTVRRNHFRDDQATPTMTKGVYEIAGEPNTAEPIVYEGNVFSTGVTTPLTIEATYTNRRIVNNRGYNPQGAAAITVGASPFTYTAGPTPEAVYVSGGTVSAIAKNSETLFASTDKTVWLEPGEAVTVTYTAAPTMTKDRK